MRAQPSDGCPRLLYRTALAFTALDLIGKSRAKAMPVLAIRAGQAPVPLRWNHLWKGSQGRADAALVRNTPSLMSGGGDTRLPGDVLRLGIRVTETIDHQVRSLRLRQIIESYQPSDDKTPPRRKGAFWGIRTPFSKYPDRPQGIDAPADRTNELAAVGTHMRGLDPVIARRIVNWGYAISDAALRSYVKDVRLDDPALPFPTEGI